MGVKEIGVYKLGRTLGAGTYGKVKWGVNSITGQEVAVKIMKPQELKDKNDIEREISILKLLNHPNIVHLFEVIHDDHGRIYLVLELVTGGEMFDYIVTRGRIKEREAKKFFRQMVSAVEYCHGNLIVHRDLKPENLLLDGDGNVKINDFGFSNVIKPGKLFTTFCGSPLYAAPEIFLAKEYVGPEVDIWSMGVILYVLVFGQLPWAVGKDGRVEDLEALLNARYEIPRVTDVSKECIDLISRMIVPKRKQRITIEEIRFHSWVQDNTGPPPCLLTPRGQVMEVNRRILEQMTLIGFDIAQSEQQILSNEKCTAVSTYHLLLSRFHAEQRPATPLTRAEPAQSKAPATAPAPDSPEQTLRPRGRSFYIPSSATQKEAHPSSPLAQSTNKFGSMKKAESTANPGTPAKDVPPTYISNLESRLDRRRSSLPNGIPMNKRFSLPVELAESPKVINVSPATPTTPGSPQAKSRRGSRILTGLFKKKRPEDSPEKPDKKQEQKSSSLRKLPSLKLGISSRGKSEKIRLTKGVFNVDTTTTKMPPDIIEEIIRVLSQNSVEYSQEGYVFRCKDTQTQGMSEQDKKHKQLQFEVEICQIKGLSMHGIKFKRVAGDVWEYRNMCQTLISQMKM